MIETVPNDKAIEAAVIGTILIDPRMLDIIQEIIHPDCFYWSDHRSIYTAMVYLYSHGYKVDLLTVHDQLKKDESCSYKDGVAGIAKLTNGVTSTAHIETHCRVLKEKYLLRQMIRIGAKLKGESEQRSADAFKLIDEIEQELFDLSVGNISGAYKHTDTLAIESIKRVDYLQDHKGEITGVPTGYTRIDKLTCGWQDTDLIILAARPSVGKTAFALNLAVNAARDENKKTPVAFFSLEMSSLQCAERCISMISNVPLEFIKRGKMTEEEKKNYTKGAEIFAKLQLFFDDSSVMTTHYIKSAARRMMIKEGVKLIIIDYLQLISTPKSNKNYSRENEVSQISKELKAMAKDLGIPVIALCQLSRTIENRSSKEPMLSDLRESGSIEQDADVVAFITRDDYQSIDGDQELSNNGWLKFRKHRNGALDNIAFKTDLKIQRWYDIMQWDSKTVRSLPVPAVAVNHWTQAVEKDDEPF